MAPPIDYMEHFYLISSHLSSHQTEDLVFYHKQFSYFKPLRKSAVGMRFLPAA